ncbi:MAG TPA: hypothetical protein VIJ68_03005 [Candidatus Saccharimonadales bacterium]
MADYETQDHEAEKRPGDLICEPDADILADWYHQHRVAEGKFIRIGGIVLMGPGFPDPLSHEPLKHFDIAYAAFHIADETLRSRVIAASEESRAEAVLRDDGRNVVDAGHYSCTIGEQGVLAALEVWGESSDLGRADEVGRQKTIDIFQGKLGSSIPVSE